LGKCKARFSPDAEGQKNKFLGWKIEEKIETYSNETDGATAT
jgi:hypothetical protein